MTKLTIKMLSFFLTLCLIGCTSNTQNENRAAGAVVGAAAGTALGAASGSSPGPITMVGTGAFVGAIIGSAYGNEMEDSDKEKAYKAIAEGKRTTWQNSKSKFTYTIIPASSYLALDGNPHCRQFTGTQTNDEGRTRKINQIACQGARGEWHLDH